MADIEVLNANINERFGRLIDRTIMANGELTLEIAVQHFIEVCMALRDEAPFDFKLLLDVCGVDYLHYGIDQWATESTTRTGFSRGVVHFSDTIKEENIPHRFASVYHLLSLTQNHRVRIRVFLDSKEPQVASVVDIWPSANWFEREAFDLFGIMYLGHPDLRRILTDYGFVGHPFRKDFPLIGNVEARYDAKEGRVIYAPVSIQPRILEPKVIRRDSRYEVGK